MKPRLACDVLAACRSGVRPRRVGVFSLVAAVTMSVPAVANAQEGPSPSVRLSEIISDGVLGADTNTVVTVNFTDSGPVRGIRLTGILLRTSASGTLAEARVEITVPDGRRFEVAPAAKAGDAGRWSFFDVYFELPIDEPTGQGEWTLRFFEERDDPDADAIWESFALALDPGPRPPDVPENDSFTAPRPLAFDSGEEVRAAFTTVNASTEFIGTDCGGTTVIPQNDVWFLLTSKVTQTVTLSLCNSVSFDASMIVWNESFDPVACDDDGCGVAGGPPLLSFEAEAGQSYRIQIGSALASGGEQGTGELLVSSSTACVIGTGGGYRPGHVWAGGSSDFCNDVQRRDALSISSQSTGYQSRYRRQLAYWRRGTCGNDSRYDHVVYDSIFWVAVAPNQPWQVAVSTQRNGWVTVRDNTFNASTITLNPVTGWVSSFIPSGSGYVPGNAAIVQGSLDAGVFFQDSEGNQDCRDWQQQASGNAVIQGVGPQSVHLNFAWSAIINAGDLSGIRLGFAGTIFPYNDVAGYPGCNGRDSNNDGHIVTVTCLPPPANDACGSCETVQLGGTVTGTNVGASTEGSAGCAPTGADVFYCLSSGCGGSITLDTCGSNFDTVLSVHTGCPATPGNEVACWDDACGLQSVLSFTAAPNTTYYVRVAGYAGAVGSIVLNVSAPAGPGNDHLAGATPVSEGVHPYTLACADLDSLPGNPPSDCGQSQPARNVWFRYFPSGCGVATISNCGLTNASDTVIYACDSFGSVILACMDSGYQYCGSGGETFFSFPVQGGTSYLISVADSAGGSWPHSGSLSITRTSPGAPANNECAGAQPIVLGVPTPFDTTCATSSTGFPQGCATSANDVWFKYTALCGGTVEASTCGQVGFQTVLNAYAIGCSGTQVGCALSNCTGTGTRMQFPVIAGFTYYILVEGATPADFGPGTLTLTQVAYSGFPPSNDECVNAIPVGVGVHPFDTTCATNTAFPWWCGGGGPDVWYRYTSPSSIGFASISLCGQAAFDTTVSVRTSCGVNLPVVMCDDDACGTAQSLAIFTTNPNTTYFFSIDGYSALDYGAGTFTLSWVRKRCQADFDNNDVVNSTDVSGFINAWFEDLAAGSAVTDYDGNGVVNSTDVSTFINAYFDAPADCT
jgi:hypothetical protein